MKKSALAFLPLLALIGCADLTAILQPQPQPPAGDAPKKLDISIDNTDGVDLTIHLAHPQPFSMAVAEASPGNPGTVNFTGSSQTLHIFGTPANQPPLPQGTNPAALGFQQYLKCTGPDVAVRGDKGTPEACLAACMSNPSAAGCWWIDGSGGFARECRICTGKAPAKSIYPHDWGLSLPLPPILPAPVSSPLASSPTSLLPPPVLQPQTLEDMPLHPHQPENLPLPPPAKPFLPSVEVLPFNGGLSGPAAAGFKQYYRCMNGSVAHLGDTMNPDACVTACKLHPHAAGCWWLDGSGDFPRECRVCLMAAPEKGQFSDDWGLTLAK